MSTEPAGARPGPATPRWSRRRFLGVAGAGVGVAAAGSAAAVAAAGRAGGGAAGAAVAPAPVPFEGPRQAGIVTPAQDRVHLAAFDLITERRADVVDLLRVWTDAARRMTAGAPVGGGATGGRALAPPDDTGEALDLPPSRLTITVGFGSGLFTGPDGTDRFGLAARRPSALRDLPRFAGDDLDPARCGGDLCVQAFADDPQVAFHAVRNLTRLAFGVAGLRWSQLGFGRTSSTDAAQATPRNLFGFKDGTANPTAADTDVLDRYVWVGPGDDPAAAWLTGGSFLVVRRITMLLHTWDRTSLAEQEAVIGRDKAHGAPLSGGAEHDPPDFTATGPDGPLVPLSSHVRLAHPDQNGGTRLLRRGYTFTDGTDGLGHLDAGLLFLAYTRDPFRHFVPMQTSLARHDALSEYVRHTGSALFAVPPGVTGPDDTFGRALFA